MRKNELFERVIRYFEENMPVAETELEYQNPFHLIVAVILSAQPNHPKFLNTSKAVRIPTINRSTWWVWPGNCWNCLTDRFPKMWMIYKNCLE